jgi:ubiquinone/menaquinone biosynthesis C-methylase UbiE
MANIMTNADDALKYEFYPESRFGGFSRVDGTLPFFTRIHALLKPESVVLDVGCGRAAASDRFETSPWEKCRILQGRCQKVIGIDVNPAGRKNPLIDEFRLIEGDRWPVEDASIDLLMSDAVLEHVQKPDQFFAECRRVLRGGADTFASARRIGGATFPSSRRWFPTACTAESSEKFSPAAKRRTSSPLTIEPTRRERSDGY